MPASRWSGNWPAVCLALFLGLRADQHLPGLCPHGPPGQWGSWLQVSHYPQCHEPPAVVEVLGFAGVPSGPWLVLHKLHNVRVFWFILTLIPPLQDCACSRWLKLLDSVCFHLASLPSATYLQFFISFYLLILAGEGITLWQGCKLDCFEVKNRLVIWPLNILPNVLSWIS